MMALTVQQPWAELIASGRKQLEYRTWRTHHRGLVVICAAAIFDNSERAMIWRNELRPLTLPTSVTVCVVELVNVEPSRRDDGYVWTLRNPRRLEPLHVRGRLGLWPIHANLVRELPSAQTA